MERYPERRADELQAEKEKRADESHIKIQIAQIEAVKEQAKIEADKELKIKEMELHAHPAQATVLQPLQPFVIKMPTPQSNHPS